MLVLWEWVHAVDLRSDIEDDATPVEDVAGTESDVDDDCCIDDEADGTRERVTDSGARGMVTLGRIFCRSLISWRKCTTLGYSSWNSRKHYKRKRKKIDQ